MNAYRGLADFLADDEGDPRHVAARFVHTLGMLGLKPELDAAAIQEARAEAVEALRVAGELSLASHVAAGMRSPAQLLSDCEVLAGPRPLVRVAA